MVMAVLGDLRLRRRVILQRARSGPLHWALVGEVNVRLRHNGTLSSGHGADTDILVAAAKAYVHALNRLAAATAAEPRLHPQWMEAPARTSAST